uniref:Pre-mRNA-processing factor 19 n=1 Tax=Chromera velia CCMP2878 TaxID=1169474 RepID=A0A0G4GH23_9ALVE|mmetsp:Transcript_14685/g.29663  ORF Transcript_14685/g.29663 Transcript_14685/m.29663 type:complete len:495 (-) Transcript_14685:370-1854(-)|eukprot:Cvel_4688.t1-p1 / transcript=Cvel_4688.t1 / gene=Cvel_4688 / organism=Chromera_velia_CCMP2878 / gene_product=U-box domain-containing protein 72, putative / transcript_product=U-box domain-containing protein 72, putative / location=Cvel_scaffold208:34411-37083(-) / protein_length=494 / sequence_SO=supercontig / SO=protein_coding / is_pseudo=false
MALVCAISGQPPEEPVFSPTGYIFEKRLIEKHLANSPTCPLTGEELTSEQLLPVRSSKNVKPRPMAANSIPGLLQLFQTEWDSTMIETFQLKTQLEQSRSQLSHTLYQHDAACRVIARVIRERDAARERVHMLERQLQEARVSGGGGQSVEPGITTDLVEEIKQLAVQLKPTRKGREHPNLKTPEQVSQIHEASSQPMHSSTTPGVTWVDLDKKVAPARKIVTGGMDGQVIVYDVQGAKTLQKLSGHGKRVTQCLFHPQYDAILSTSEDKSLRVWSMGGNGKYACNHVIRKHTAAVNGLAIHPIITHAGTASADASWAFVDLQVGQVVQSFVQGEVPLKSCSFHPDGLIMGTGDMNGNIHMWDLTGGGHRATLEGHTGPITSLSFSENGYFLASSSADGTVRVWDLRKTATLHNITIGDGSKAVNQIVFDYSGHYLTVAGSPNVHVFRLEGKAACPETAVFSGHNAAVSSVAVAQNMEWIVSAGMDRAVKVWEG